MSAWPTSAAAAVAVALAVCSAAAGAQPAAGGEAVHERLEVTIREDGSAHVLHEIKRSDTPVTVPGVQGNHSGAMVTDAAGNEIRHDVSEGDGALAVALPAPEAGAIIEYDLAGAVARDGHYLTWEYSYPAATTFVMPQGTARVYLNGAAVDIGNGRVLCHGCYALLEYSPDERIYSYALAGGAPEERMEIRTAAEVTGAGIDPGVGVISAEIAGGERAFVDVAVPKALLGGPYEAYLDGSRIVASVASENATHAWLQARAGGGTLNVFGEGGSPGGGGGAPMWVVGVAAIIAGAAGVAVTLAVWARRRGGVR